ncbi:hypothetical protein ACH5RR_002922 [Cinchona calisaya]|uniref:Uncharacterized protein n=1 Tax=Cinchona calisaya TaxID=153742 RepID=A0ABD3ATE3_9GENT
MQTSLSLSMESKGFRLQAKKGRKRRLIIFKIVCQEGFTTRQTTCIAEIFSKAKGDKYNVLKERDRQKRLICEEDEALKNQEAASQREQQIKAIIIALEMMEKTISFEDNLMIFKELEGLSQCSQAYVLDGYHGSTVMVLRGLQTGKVGKPLE